jgi:hypothetical protein
MNCKRVWKWGLKIDYGKTEYLGTDHSEELQISGNTTPTVKQFKYLRSKMQKKVHLILKLKKKRLVKQEEFQKQKELN